MTIRAVVASPAKHKSQNARATCCITGPTKALMALPIREASYRQSKTEPREPTPSKLCAGQACLTPACGQVLAADCIAQTRWGSDQPENKSAGGYPPALGESPNWETQLDYAIAPCELLETLLPELLEEVLLEVAESPEERRIGLSLQMPFELQVGQLDSANVVSNLGKTIAACNGILIDNRLVGNARFDRPMYRFGHNTLSTVVVNLDGIKLLQIGEMGSQELNEVFFYCGSKGIWAKRPSLLFVGKHSIRYGESVNETSKSAKLPLSIRHVFPLVFVMPIYERVKVKRNAVQLLDSQLSHIFGYAVFQGQALLMKHEADKVEVRNTTNIARLIDEDGQFSHQALPSRNPSRYKKCRGTPPALGGPPIRSIHLLYTTNRNVYSIVPRVEHMFYTIDTNICSPYRKAG